MRRLRSRLMRSTSIGTPAGKPSTTAVRPGPWDSPAVRYRSTIRRSAALRPLLPQPLGRRQLGRSRRDDLRREEDEQLLVVRRVQVVLEEPPEDGNAAEVGQARLRVVRRMPEDAAEDHRVPVVDQHVRVGLPAHLGGNVVDRVREVGLARLREDVHQHEAVGGYLRRDHQRDARVDLLGRDRRAPGTPPAPVFTTVPVEGSFTRRIVRLSIVAATLFMVMTRGRLITLPLPSCSSAVKRAASACVPSIEPSARSSAEPEPGPKPDPKFAGTGKSARNGTGEVGTPGTAGVGAVPAPSAAPPTPTVPGKLLPVGLPVSGPAWKL